MVIFNDHRSPYLWGRLNAGLKVGSTRTAATLKDVRAGGVCVNRVALSAAAEFASVAVDFALGCE